MGTVADRIADGRALPSAERRVAQAVLDDPELVAFGTVAALARRSGASGATVVRLADRLGYQGFIGMQNAVQQELAVRLRPATERIRQRAAGNVVARTLAAELENVQRTLEGLDAGEFRRAVGLLSGRRAAVYVVAGGALAGVAATFATQLGMLRAGVSIVDGNPVAVSAGLAHAGRADVVAAIDVRRYDRWLVETVLELGHRGARLVVVTDSRLSPLARSAAVALVAAADGAGPFDSNVGVLAATNALVNGVAARLRASAPTDRLDRLEAAWRASEALTGD